MSHDVDGGMQQTGNQKPEQPAAPVEQRATVGPQDGEADQQERWRVQQIVRCDPAGVFEIHGAVDVAEGRFRAQADNVMVIDGAANR